MTPFRVLADIPLPSLVTQLLDERVELMPWDATSGRIDGIFTYGHTGVDVDLLIRLPDLRVISNFGVGVDHIDTKAAALRGIPVGNTPGVLDGAVADLAFALILAAGRRIVEADRFTRNSVEAELGYAFQLGREIHHSTLGIFGMGRIGFQVAKRANAFDMAVIYHSRRRKEEAERSLGCTYMSKDELLAAADYVVLTLPLTAETHGLIGRAELEKMKPTASLINVARGAIVDTNALTEALSAGRIGSAALDVTSPEPLPGDHPLLKLSNVTLTPHLGSATEETRRQMAALSVDNLIAGLERRSLPSRVA